MSFNNPSISDLLPIATYTHSANTEIVISAVNVGTDTFTSVGHGLINTNKIYPVMNYDAGNIYPIDKYPGGITYASGYFVVNKTTDTFQLSLTSGGAVIDLTTNANLDLTKWHFEKWISDPIISGLPSLSKCKILIKGKNLDKGATPQVTPTGITYSAEWLQNGNNTYFLPFFGFVGDVSIDVEIVIDYKKYLTLKCYGYGVASSTSSANISTLNEKLLKSPKYREGTFNSITISGLYIANGTVVEVYKA